MTIDLDDLRAAFAAAGLADEPTGLTRLTAGASQETYRVELGDRTVALRRSPVSDMEIEREGEAIGLFAEGRVIRTASAAGVPVPDVLHVFDADPHIGDALLVEWLDGETLGSRIVRSEKFAAVRPSLARQCGEILARIHAFDDRSALSELPTPSPEDLVNDTWERYRSLGTPQPMIDFAARWLLDHLPASGRSTLVHGDFRNGNLMFSPDDGVIGVLDWELAHFGDPMRDLGWLCTGSWRFGADAPVGGFGDYDELFAGYESVSGSPVDRDAVHFWEVFGSFWWSVGCLGMVDVHRQGIDKSSERLAIGRRSSECQADCVNLLIPGAYEVPDAAPNADAPSIAELLGGVTELLRDDEFADGLDDRYRYLARVAANSVGIAARDSELGPAARAAELDRLRSLLDHDGSLVGLRIELCERLQSDRIDRDRVELAEYLRESVMAQLAIDQPRYPALTRPSRSRTPT